MTELQIKTSSQDLNELVISGQLTEAFEKYYHDEVEMQENGNEPIKGKNANRKRELEFLNKITEFRGASVPELQLTKISPSLSGAITTRTKNGELETTRRSRCNIGETDK